jgi:hypothetical protein
VLILLLPNQLANASNQWLDVALKIRINPNEQHEQPKNKNSKQEEKTKNSKFKQ